MGGKRGRAFVWRLLDKSGVRADPFSTNASQTAYNLGTAAYGRWLTDELLSTCPDNYLLMLKEHDENARDTSDDSGGNIQA